MTIKEISDNEQAEAELQRSRAVDRRGDRVMDAVFFIIIGVAFVGVALRVLGIV